MPNAMAAWPSIGGALCERSVIPLLVSRHKVWLTAAAQVPFSNAANIEECKTWTQSEFCSWQNSIRGQEPPQMYIVYQPRRRPNIVQSFVDLHWATSVQQRDQDAKTRWNWLWCPKLGNISQLLVGQSSPYCKDIWRRYCHLTSFFSDCRYMP